MERSHLLLDCHLPIPSIEADSEGATDDEKAPFVWLICCQAPDLHSLRYSASHRCEKVLKMVSSKRIETRINGSEHGLLLELGLQRPDCADEVGVVDLL